MDCDKRGDSEQSPTAKSKSTRKKYSSVGCRTGNWILPPSIQTLPSWMEDRSGDTLTSSAEASLVRTSALRRVNNKQESTESVPVYGENTPDSFAKFDPDGSSWRTSQTSLFSECIEYSGTWPQAGMMRNGVVFQRQRWAHRTKETESGSSGNWPTPPARDWKGPPGKGCQERGGHQSSLPAEVSKRKMWRSPGAADNRNRGNMSLPSIQRRVAMGKQLNLAMLVDPTSGALSADWVELLMGYPMGWTRITNASDGNAESQELLRGKSSDRQG